MLKTRKLSIVIHKVINFLIIRDIRFQTGRIWNFTVPYRKLHGKNWKKLEQKGATILPIP